MPGPAATWASNDKHVTAMIGRLFTAWPMQRHGHDCESHLQPHPTPRNVHRNQCPAARQFAATRITHKSCDEWATLLRHIMADEMAPGAESPDLRAAIAL